MDNLKEAYAWVSERYAGKSAQRSGQPYMQHIDEGIEMLLYLGASDEVRAAYCLHPLFQSDNDLEISKEDSRLALFDPIVLLYVMEYRSKANSYLCAPLYDNSNCPDSIEFPLEGVRLMLVADKIQNKRDFHKFHKDHQHYEALDVYFENWMDLLEFPTGVF